MTFPGSNRFLFVLVPVFPILQNFDVTNFFRKLRTQTFHVLITDNQTDNHTETKLERVTITDVYFEKLRKHGTLEFHAD